MGIFSDDLIQKVSDVVLFSTHQDPHLKGQVALVIGNFIKQVLHSSLTYDDFLLRNCSTSSFTGKLRLT